jgi:hypothetical protein
MENLYPSSPAVQTIQSKNEIGHRETKSAATAYVVHRPDTDRPWRTRQRKARQTWPVYERQSSVPTGRVPHTRLRPSINRGIYRATIRAPVTEPP